MIIRICSRPPSAANSLDRKLRTLFAAHPNYYAVIMYPRFKPIPKAAVFVILVKEGLKINVPFCKFRPFPALLLYLRLGHSFGQFPIPALRKLSVPVNNRAGGGGGTHTLNGSVLNRKRDKTVSEMPRKSNSKTQGLQLP